MPFFFGFGWRELGEGELPYEMRNNDLVLHASLLCCLENLLYIFMTGFDVFALPSLSC